METIIIQGDNLKDKIFSEVKNELTELKAKYNTVPVIAFIAVGEVPLSKYVIPLHVQTAEAAGFKVILERKPANATEVEMFDLIDQLNANPDVHAIVLLQPLPEHLVPIRIINRIDKEKEVEGFHPQNMLSTMIPDIQTQKYPMCLPTALLELLEDAKVQLRKDQEWVFVLDDEFISNTLTHMVVKSAAAKAMPLDCSLSIVNKDSKHLIEYCQRADVLVVVTKHPEYIQPSWLKIGVCIVDVYSNLLKEVPSKKDPTKLMPIIRGGVNVESVKNIAGVIVPVPGGVVAVVLPILLQNALIAFKQSLPKIL